jgi:hypothetical protein
MSADPGHQPTPEPDRLEAATDQAIAACGGNARDAVRALIVANEFLESEVCELMQAVSHAYANRKGHVLQNGAKRQKQEVPRKHFCSSPPLKWPISHLRVAKKRPQLGGKLRPSWGTNAGGPSTIVM